MAIWIKSDSELSGTVGGSHVSVTESHMGPWLPMNGAE